MAILGSSVPRLFTEPLRELTPETSYGFRVIEFARDVLKTPLDPWQEFVVIHGGELLEDGITPRFRQLLVCVPRQQGKTHLLTVLSLFWLFVEKLPLILGTSNKLESAKEAWSKAVQMAQDTPELDRFVDAVLRGNNDVHMRTDWGSKYKIAAANRGGGRGLSIDRLIIDEVREQRDWLAYNAAIPAMNARPQAQAWFISNMGDDASVVLNSLREDALAGLDQRLGLIEWSAEPGSDIEDPDAWAAAMPNLGGPRNDISAIEGMARRAKVNGGTEEASFRTEMLCERVRALDAAVDPRAWLDATTDITLDAAARNRVSLCLDLSPDAQHATLCAAVEVDGLVHVEIVEAWEGWETAKQLRTELPVIVARIKPRTLGWFPYGPGAVLLADLGKSRHLPSTVKVEEIRGQVSAVCMGFAEAVKSGTIRHPADQLLDAHVLQAERLRSGDQWKFSRKGQGHCDAAYAAAGACHLARTVQAPKSTRVIVSSEVRAYMASSGAI